MEKTQDIWELLENAPKRFEAIAEIYSWSLNYDCQTGTPWQKFLDLIGYSAEEFGQHICETSFDLDYLSADYIISALEIWSNSPQDTFDFITKILHAE
jgi:hypothetical protein